MYQVRYKTDPAPGTRRPELSTRSDNTLEEWCLLLYDASSACSCDSRSTNGHTHTNQTLRGQNYDNLQHASWFHFRVILDYSLYNLDCTTEPGWFYAGAKGGAAAEVEPAAPL